MTGGVFFGLIKLQQTETATKNYPQECSEKWFRNEINFLVKRVYRGLARCMKAIYVKTEIRVVPNSFRTGDTRLRHPGISE
jgi:hypothetical protein